MTIISTIGNAEVYVFSDGIMPTSLEVVLNMDLRQARELVGGCDDVPVPVHNYVFERSGRLFLIDAGSGPARQKTLGKLVENMKKSGIDPKDIDTILLTHIHADHADGLVGLDGEATFPNAEIILHSAEYDFWMGEDHLDELDKLRTTRAKNNLRRL